MKNDKGIKIGKLPSVSMTKGLKIQVPVTPVVEEPKVEVKVQKKAPVKKSKAKKSKSVKKSDNTKKTV